MRTSRSGWCGSWRTCTRTPRMCVTSACAEWRTSESGSTRQSTVSGHLQGHRLLPEKPPLWRPAQGDLAPDRERADHGSGRPVTASLCGDPPLLRRSERYVPAAEPGLTIRFRLAYQERTRGKHQHKFFRPDVDELLNLQETDGGKALPGPPVARSVCKIQAQRGAIK